MKLFGIRREDEFEEYLKSEFQSQHFEIAKHSDHPIHWGTKGLSLNIDKGGVHVPYCFDYPPNSSSKQGLFAALVGQGRNAKQTGYYQRRFTAIIIRRIAVRFVYFCGSGFEMPN